VSSGPPPLPVMYGPHAGCPTKVSLFCLSPRASLCFRCAHISDWFAAFGGFSFVALPS